VVSSVADIDWSRVEAAVLGDKPSEILSFDFSDVKTMIFAAAEKWLATDLKTLSNLQTELPFNISSLGQFPTRGFIDLSAVYTHGELSGAGLVADWKTSDGELDVNWQSRLVGSFQWKLYAYVTGAKYISYRGVNRKGKTREVFIKVPEFAIEQAVRQFRLVSTQIAGMVNEDVWTQKMPSSCGAFNSTCQFLNDCQTDSMPRYVLNPAEIGLSYSGMDRFNLCPEKFRRVAKTADEGNESTRLGSAFHRGVEEVWRQAFGLEVR
jgi:hypothetical protein